MPKKKVTSEKEEAELNLVEIKKALDNAEKQIKLAKKLMFNQLYNIKTGKLKTEPGMIEGVFDGEDMIGADGKRYNVPCNYASKSKLVAGDVMKLTISSDGTYTYKQIGPIERKRLTGVLSETDSGFCVEVDDKLYNILGASVTFFKAKDGDRVAVMVAKDQESNWAALDHILSEV